jgi:hypothetical protein
MTRKERFKKGKEYVMKGEILTMQQISISGSMSWRSR